MPSNPSQWVKSAISIAGAATAGPVGAIVGRLAGSMLDACLPGISGFLNSIAGSLPYGEPQELSAKITSRLTPADRLHINHDLQSGFMDACCEALYDIGGKQCFPQVWSERPQDVPQSVLFPATPEGRMIWHTASPLGSQVAECLQQMEHAIREQLIIPLDPPNDQPAASAEAYLQAQNPAEMNRGFFEEMIWPFFVYYQPLNNELPALAQHLQNHLLDRSLVHMGRILSIRTPAWRAFNRAVLEGLHAQVRELTGGQVDIIQRLEALAPTTCSEELADDLADLLTAYGRMEKDDAQGLDELGLQAAEFYRKEMEQLMMASAASQPAETQAERKLRFQENGKYVIEGPAPAAADLWPAPGEPPFKGLLYYEETDAPLFFGRELLAARLASLLNDRPILIVTGASGSGKSSLVRAGLIPALRGGKKLTGSLAPGRRVLADGSFPPLGSERWPVLVLTPTAHPFEALAACLTRGSESMREAVMLLDELRADPGNLEVYIRRIAGPAEPLRKALLVVDQFEELFTLCHDPTERQEFIEMLLKPAAQGLESPLRLVIALRADFYASCAQYPGLREALSKWQEYIGPMEPRDVRRAIEEPARLGGWSFEPGLVERILRDFIAGDSETGIDDTQLPEPGALPLLSHALLETWTHRRGRMMTLESYAETGGVRKAIAHTADAMYQGRLNDAQQAAARKIFLRLTELGEGTQDTRRRARLDELSGGGIDEQDFAAVLNVLTESRLVTKTEETVELAHEALIHEWPTLQYWLEEDREGIRIQRRLSEAAEQWQHNQQDTSLLYSGARLVEAREWAAEHAEELSSLEAFFLAASRTQQHGELRLASQRAETQTLIAARMKKRSATLAWALLIVAALALFSIFSWQRADGVAKQAIIQRWTAEAAQEQAVQQRSTAEQQMKAAQDQKNLADQQKKAAEEAQQTAQAASAQVLIENGWKLYQEGQYPQAKIQFEKALATDSRAVEANLGRAWVAYQLKDYPNAAADFEEASKGKPALLDKNAWNALGWAYFRSEVFAKALESFTRAIELDARYEDAVDGQGWSQYRLEDYPAAVASFEKGLALNPNNVDFYDGLGHAYYRMNDYTKAIENTKKAIALDKAYAYTLNLNFLGWSYFYLDNYTQARVYFEQAKQGEPDNFDSYRGLGDIDFQQKKMDKALENYRKYLELIRGNGSPEVYVLARIEELTNQ